MKERGIGTGALVGIVVGVVVAVVVPVIIAAVLLAGGGTGGVGDGTGGSIIGTWQGSHLGATETFVFKSDGTYDWSSNGSQASGSWSMNGDILSLDDYPFKVVFGNNTMEWYEQEDSSWMTTPSRSFTRVA